jgi:hypothetical protein
MTSELQIINESYMSKYYIVDSTLKQSGKNPVIIFESIPGVIKYLENMCSRHFGQSRKQYMEHVESVGHSADEETGRSFYDQMEQYFNIGVIRNGKEPIKTNIFQADAFLRGKDAHGN